MTPADDYLCRHCGSALVIDGLRLVAATASGEAARICPNDRLGHDMDDGDWNDIEREALR